MDAFEALADPVRRSLLLRVAMRPERVADLAASYDISRPAISRHLRLLSEAGLVNAADRGRERLYELRRDGLNDVRAYLGQLSSPAAGALFTGNALDALDTEVRRTSRDRRSTSQTTTATKESA